MSSGRGESIAARELVDVTCGLVSREIFVSPELYEREQEQVFARAWLFIGHESQIPNPGDYFVSRMGEESVILTRDLQGSIHVLLNTCRHRGMKVCRYTDGNTRTFMCPYHGWTYSIDGSVVETPGGLLGVPHFDAAYHGQLDKNAWGLFPVAQLANYKGGIFATWDPEAPAFLDYVGGMKLWLDALFDHRDGREGGSEVLGGVQRWRIPCNWKFVAENFAGDMYHGTSHVSVEAAEIGPGGRGQDRHGVKTEGRAPREGITAFPELGHGARGAPTPHDRPFPTFSNPLIDDYFRKCWAERRHRLDGRLVAGGNGGNLFPNMPFHQYFPRSIAVAHPQGPLETEMWRWYLVDADAPEEVKDALRVYFMRYSGPSGMTEQDDMENWNYASQASKGVMARRLPYNYTQGIGLWTSHDAAPGGRISDEMVSEENARALYGRWAEYMDAESWADLRPAGDRSRSDASAAARWTNGHDRRP